LLLASLLLGACATGAPASPPAAAPTAPAAPGAASAPAPAASPRPLDKVRLAVPAKSLVFLPYYLGQQKGLYAEQGIDLEIAVVQPSTAIAAVIAGEVEYTAASGSALGAGLSGAPLRNVMFVMADLLFGLYAQPDVRTIAGLAGGTVAVTNRFGTDDYALAALLRHGGVADDSVTRVTASTTANSFAALTGNAVTGAVLSPPYAELAERQNFTYLGYAADVLKRDQSGLATNLRRIEQHPDEVRRMIRATLASIRYSQDHPDETTAFVATLFEIEPGLATSATQKALKALTRDGKMPTEAIDATAVDLSTAQGVANPPRGSTLVDFRLLDEVLRAPGSGS
jgi:NitT/TauT family transport system substrate-binding protein